MKKLGLFATLLIGLSTAACTTHNGGNASDAGSASSGGGGGGSGSSTQSSSCALPVGTYVIEYTLISGAGCSQLSNSTFTIGAGQTSMSTSPGCITSNDSTSCMTTTTCNSTSNGFTTQSDSVATISGASASGTLHETESNASGPVLDCTYDFSVTKQ